MRGGVENYYEEKVLTLSFVLASCVNLSAFFCLSAGGWGVWLHWVLCLPSFVCQLGVGEFGCTECCVCLLLFVSWGLRRLAAVLRLWSASSLLPLRCSSCWTVSWSAPSGSLLLPLRFLTPSLPKPVKFPGLKVHAHASKQYIFQVLWQIFQVCAFWCKPFHV